MGLLCPGDGWLLLLWYSPRQLEPFGSVSSPGDLVGVVRAATGQYAPGLGWTLVYSERLLSAPRDLIYSSNQHTNDP